jgi:hypothetical protein
VSEQPDAPVVRVVRGSPSPEELAALVAVLASAGDDSAAGPDTMRRSRWAAPPLEAGRLHRPGPGAWRASALPR